MDTVVFFFYKAARTQHLPHWDHVYNFNGEGKMVSSSLNLVVVKLDF